MPAARDHDGLEAELRAARSLQGLDVHRWPHAVVQQGRRHHHAARADERAAAKEKLDRVLDAADADLAALLFRELWAEVESAPPTQARSEKASSDATAS